MTLATIWFILIFVLLGGYAILDGFDLGVGILHLLNKDDNERRIAINAIAPVWDGNEVWLLTGGGALFAAFPMVYATVFSGFYLALMLLLLALILRAVSMEFRGKVDSPRWRRAWDLAFFFGSLLPGLLLGVALGNILRGIPLNEDHDFAGTFLGLLNPYALVVGLFTLVMFTTHGAVYLAGKTSGAMHSRIVRYIKPLWMVLLAFLVISEVATLMTSPNLMVAATHRMWLSLPAILILAAAVCYLPIAALTTRNFSHAIVASSAIIGSMMILTAVSLFPNLVPAINDPARTLDIYNSSSSQLTLKVMLIIALAGMPIVVTYTAIIYRAFRGKVVLGEESY